MENITQQTDPTQITVADLDLLRNIVDLAATRGAFRGNELTQVGIVYDKLNNFLLAILEQAKQQTDGSDTTTEPPKGE